MPRNLFIFLFLLISLNVNSQKIKYQLRGTAQGTTFNFIYYLDSSVILKKSFLTGIDSIIKVIDTSFSLYSNNSLINLFNRSPRGIKINSSYTELFNYIFKINKVSKNFFDPTIYALKNYWLNIDNSNSPNISSFKKNNFVYGIDLLIINEDSLIKLHPKVLIDLDGIAQGYTVDKIADYFEANGIYNYLIELGGEIRFSGTKKNETSYFTVLLNGSENSEEVIKLYSSNKLEEFNALTTAGLNKNIKYGLKKAYINPNTGMPSNSDILSVSVLAKNATIADAYDNVLILMNHTEAIKFLNKNKFLEARIIYSVSGKLKYYYTNGFKRRCVKTKKNPS